MRRAGKNPKTRHVCSLCMSQRILSSFICLLLLTSIAPAAAATGPSDSVIWGVSYDWGNFEGDVLEMTGVDTNAANEDLEEAAEYAGFDLASDEVLSGSSHFFIESWDGDETVEIQDIHGNSHQVSQRITELTVRHGLLADAGFTASWIDNDEAIDIWYSASQEMVLVIDATYVEYVDSDLLVYGADLEMSGVVSNTADLSMNLQVIAAGEVEAPEVDLGYSISMEVPSLSSEWRVDQPLDYLQQLNQEPSDGGNGIFVCDNGEEIPADWENDGYEDCSDGSDEYAIWDCRVDVKATSLSSLDEWSYNEAIDGISLPSWCNTIVPRNLSLDGSQPDLPPEEDHYVWFDEQEDQILARTADHIWFSKAYHSGEHYQSESDCMDDGGEEWDSSLELCGFPLAGEDQIDSSLIYWETPWGESGWNRYQWSGDYLFIGVPENATNIGESEGGIIEGTFTTLTGYSLSAEISGIPTEEIGVNLDTFNVELSDNVPGQGSFSENFLNIDGQMAEWNWECPPVGGTEDLTIDDTTVEVQCGIAAPVSPGMAVMMAQSLAPAFDNGVQELSSVLQEQIESWIEEISGGDGGDDVFVCDNGEEIPAYWENDGYEDCSDGSDENDEGSTFTCDNGEEIPAYWENDGEEDCSDGSDENDGSMEGSEQSERLESMFEALMESNLNKTMEAFFEKLDVLVEDNVPSEPIIDLEDSCVLLFWTTDDSRVVGFAILNSEELLLGPSVFGVKTHDVELKVLYHDGDNARTAKTDIVGITELRDIAPESKHDNSQLYEILGPDYLPDLNMQDTDGDGIIDYFDQDDDNDGISDWDDPELNSQGDSLPAPGVLAIISMLGAAAILMHRRDD